ncbi:MAG: PleD family two-component system response regulator [Hyphomonadaceae bacterium]|nr:MAG: two-component system cell cycle response regulator [Caulobacteraceae bacterium]MBT9445437.1 PleD family two-component system response regulator [Hyphomonadaceae bacterium]TPW06986.1 MAG: two-component system, cell cycle response regulator [Alphaproteobacteria bacterium]
MSARILVVDDVPANLRLIEAKLGAEYYEVITASRGEEALLKAWREQPDIILLDVMMPGMDGFETCRRLKTDPETRHIPVVMVTALDQREDRLRGLEAGAEDFLSKPFDDVQLLARVRSLARLKVVIDELRSREASGRRIGLIEKDAWGDGGLGGRILVIDDAKRQADKIRRALEPEHTVVMMGDADEASGGLDLFVVSVTAESFDGLKLIARLHSGDGAKRLPILAVVDPDDPARCVRALELGAHDIIYRPIDPDELASRARSLIKRRRYVEALRQSLDESLELAVTDQMTGLFNRRYLTSQLEPLVQRARRGGEPVSLMVADIDYFKRINDSYGHDVGDEVIKEFAARLATNFRPVDIACRYGGEEFVVVMPGTRGDYACLVAERVRRHMAGSPFVIRGGLDRIEVTVSIGVAVSAVGADSAERLLKRADEALYKAKQTGRNRVMSEAA